eukprot:6134429-Alexandrium_andersonii.AAC.1
MASGPPGGSGASPRLARSPALRRRTAALSRSGRPPAAAARSLRPRPTGGSLAGLQRQTTRRARAR